MCCLGDAEGHSGRGSIIFDHEGAPCIDSGLHRRCKGRWRGVLSRGFGPDGTRRRYKVSGRTKQDVVDSLKKKAGELDAGLSATRTYKVENAAHDWLEHGLPGRSERTRTIYRDALAPLLARIGTRPLRDLTAGEVGRNVAALLDTPKGRTGRRRRAFTLGQAAALVAASRELPEVPRHAGLKDPRRSASCQQPRDRDRSDDRAGPVVLGLAEHPARRDAQSHCGR